MWCSASIPIRPLKTPIRRFCTIVGGVISPLLANIALDGMERLFGAETSAGTPIPPAKRKHPNTGISLIRYADDFVVTAPSREVLQTYVQPHIITFLTQGGLILSETKT